MAQPEEDKFSSRFNEDKFASRPKFVNSRKGSGQKKGKGFTMKPIAKVDYPEEDTSYPAPRPENTSTREEKEY